MVVGCTSLQLLGIGIVEGKGRKRKASLTRYIKRLRTSQVRETRTLGETG
jgi:hypothetical protein